MLKRSYLNVFFYVKDIFGTTESNRWPAAPPPRDTVHNEPAGCRYVSKIKLAVLAVLSNAYIEL